MGGSGSAAACDAGSAIAGAATPQPTADGGDGRLLSGTGDLRGPGRRPGASLYTQKRLSRFFSSRGQSESRVPPSTRGSVSFLSERGLGDAGYGPGRRRRRRGSGAGCTARQRGPRLPGHGLPRILRRPPPTATASAAAAEAVAEARVRASQQCFPPRASAATAATPRWWWWIRWRC